MVLLWFRVYKHTCTDLIRLNEGITRIHPMSILDPSPIAAGRVQHYSDHLVVPVRRGFGVNYAEGDDLFEDPAV